GGYWFVRNEAILGNPLYPLSLAVGPLRMGAEGMGLANPWKEARLLGGAGAWRWLLFPFLPTWYSHEWGLGVLPGVIVVAGFFALPWLYLRRKAARVTRWMILLLLAHLLGWWEASREFRHLILVWPAALALFGGPLWRRGWSRMVGL